VRAGGQADRVALMDDLYREQQERHVDCTPSSGAEQYPGLSIARRVACACRTARAVPRRGRSARRRWSCWSAVDVMLFSVRERQSGTLLRQCATSASAAMQPRRDRTWVSLHVLRHSFAAVAAELGFSELTIAGLLGHRVSGITARYAHVPDRALLTAADQVSARLAIQMGRCRTGRLPAVRDK
jgi:hypothetical protein